MWRDRRILSPANGARNRIKVVHLQMTVCWGARHTDALCSLWMLCLPEFCQWHFDLIFFNGESQIMPNICQEGKNTERCVSPKSYSILLDAQGFPKENKNFKALQEWMVLHIVVGEKKLNNYRIHSSFEEFKTCHLFCSCWHFQICFGINHILIWLNLWFCLSSCALSLLSGRH